MERLLQAKNVAQILNCSESHVYQLEKRGLLPCSYIWPCKQSGKEKKSKVMKRWVESDVRAFLVKFKNGKKEILGEGT